MFQVVPPLRRTAPHPRQFVQKLRSPEVLCGALERQPSGPGVDRVVRVQTSAEFFKFAVDRVLWKKGWVGQEKQVDGLGAMLGFFKELVPTTDEQWTWDEIPWMSL